MQKLGLIVVSLVVALYPKYSFSYSEGAPSAVCSSMTPGHHAQPQTTSSPFVISLSKSEVKGGDTVDVNLTSTSGEQFKGFFAVGAAKQSNLEQIQPVGDVLKFLGAEGPEGPEVQTVKCPTGTGITHSDSKFKNSVTFQWKAPNKEGDYLILATFVKDYNTFWVKQSSPVIHVKANDESDLPIPAEEKATQSETVKRKLQDFYTECGTTRGCFGLPAGCKADTCEMFTSWRVDGTKYRFQIAGRLPNDGSTQGHVSMGLSLDAKMGQDSVVGCVYQNSVAQPKSYYNVPDGKDNSAFTIPTIGLSESFGEHIEGWVFCNFTREAYFDTTELKIPFDLAGDKYHILLARASSISTNKNTKLEKLGYHADGSDRDVSSESTYMTDTKILGSKSNILIQLHGAVMVIAWVMTSSLGMFVARYYKQTHTDFNPFNKAFWFALHVGSMFLTIGLTFAGIIFIFVEIGGYSSISTTAGKAHPILGLILTAICCLQLTIGLLRPHPGTPMRPIFNWVHWTAGNVGHIVGIACIFLAVDLSKSGVQKSNAWLLTIGLFVLFHILMHGTLSIHTVWADKKMDHGNKHRGISFGPMKPSKPEEAPGTNIRTFLLVLYIVGILAFGITLITLLVKGSA